MTTITFRKDRDILDALNASEEGVIKVRPQYQTGSGRYAKYSTDMSAKIEKCCEKYGLKFEFGNDAPKGGRLGNYYLIRR